MNLRRSVPCVCVCGSKLNDLIQKNFVFNSVFDLPLSWGLIYIIIFTL